MTRSERDRRGHYATVSAIKAANKAAGHSWFSPDTIDYWGTRIESGVLAGCLFITSEQPPEGPRVYSVRYATSDGHVSTWGDFGHLPTHGAALDAANRAAATLLGDQ